MHPLLKERTKFVPIGRSLNRFGRGRGADMLAGNKPSDIFRELQDEDDDGEPNAVVDGSIDDFGHALRIGCFA